MIFFHVITAIVSLIAASLTAYFPTKEKLILTYIFTVGTLASGIVLTVIQPETLPTACTSGAMFLTVVLVLTGIARKKLLLSSH